ncbi:hypothetical protein [Paenibacillus massiliensis]|uniref:hypothetical protein n=1 Tax=Paenibacillus massiliensis TaxID=225917 RepID=UPI00037C5F55|nr:hypothetical protein [Paenibacillus massiliensis]
MHQFLNWLTKLVEQLTGRSITVDWGKEISIYKERVKELEKDRKKRTRKSKPSLSNSSNDLDSQYDFFSS